MATTLETTQTHTVTVPLASTLATLIALGTLYYTAGHAPILILIGLALLGVHLFPYRIDNPPWVHMILRLVLIMTVIGANIGNFSRTDGPWLFDASTVALFGAIWAAEVVVQSWRRRPGGEAGPALIVLFSGLTFLAACTTNDIDTIKIVSPIYFLLTAISMAQFRDYAPPKLSRFVLGGRVLALTLAISLGSLTYFFFQSYHNQISDLGNRLIQERRVSQGDGISTEPELGRMFNGQSSTVRVLRIVGPGGLIHLRGLAFDTYQHGHWTPRLRGRDFKPAAESELRENAVGPHARVVSLAPVNALLFQPLGSAGLRPLDNEDIEIDRGIGHIFRVRDEIPGPYEIVLGTDEDQPVLTAGVPTDTERQRDLAVPPEIDPRVRRMAQSITQGIATPERRALAIQNYLISHYAYSLTIDPGPGDPLSNFLLKKKSAHCEYFASAAVILMRCAGVPARYVTGYYAHESEGPDVTIVRQQDSHAWSEAWIAGKGWLTIDATPGGGRPDQTGKPVSSWEKLVERFQDLLANVRAWLSKFTLSQIVLTVGGVIAVYFLIRAIWLARAPKKIAGPGFSYATRDAALEDLATRFNTYLRRRYQTVPASRTWREQIAQPLPEKDAVGIDTEHAEAFIDHYNQLRFGRESEPETVTHLQEILQTLEKGASTR